MKWAEFKEMTVREHIAFADALVQASSIEEGDATPGVMWKGETIESEARELAISFLDDGVFRFKEGSIAEILSDQAINLVDATVDWVDRALRLVRFAVPVLDKKPLANLPF